MALELGLCSCSGYRTSEILSNFNIQWQNNDPHSTSFFGGVKFLLFQIPQWNTLFLSLTLKATHQISAFEFLTRKSLREILLTAKWGLMSLSLFQASHTTLETLKRSVRRLERLMGSMCWFYGGQSRADVSEWKKTRAENTPSEYQGGYIVEV